MEENLTMEELQVILEASRKRDMNNWRFQASLKGINLDESMSDGETGTTVEDKINEMNARSAGVSKDTWDFNNIGIAIETE